MKFKSFTLMELLVVIAIIAVLSGVVIVGLGGTKDKGLDTKRLSDLRQLQLAIETYRSVNGVYPDAGDSWGAGYRNYILNLAPNYITELPHDPKYDSPQKGYKYWLDPASKKIYCVMAFESIANPQSQKDLADYYYNGVCYKNTWYMCSNGYKSPCP